MNGGDGSFEVQMEDPMSPTTCNDIVDAALSQAQHDSGSLSQWQQQQRQPVGRAETGTLQSKKKRTPEIMITSHEEQAREQAREQGQRDEEDSDAETSPSSDEDDYPDQVRRVDWLGK
jgi:hypothetical protein